MALLLPIVLATLVSCAVTVAAEDLASCGISRYYPSQYTCFDDNFLCPIVNGDRFIRCGDACYTTALYSCSNTTLAPLSHSGQQPLEDCGSSKFNPFDYVCLDGDFLCPINGVEATLRCGATCYEPFLYRQVSGSMRLRPFILPSIGELGGPLVAWRQFGYPFCKHFLKILGG
ncbi:carbohydrate binding-domain-containing protein [Mycena belliarum]|uniref:Carbohydrate binding-domain-containing protein n=1 Tax=Mycena belliarum TaxID=1033014 RepID=A0AAD6TSK5_9AGAR|nr:carbohydrate binding-domain-containing protein [Mycena belliae]